MGGGRVTRPNFDQPQASRANPLTEFYELLQTALDRHGSFALPGAYVAFRPPLDQKLYQEDVRDYCQFSSVARPGWVEIFPPSRLPVLYNDLRAREDGTPSALLLTRESTHQITAVQLVPPVVSESDPLAPPPQCTSVLSMELTLEDMILVDSDPARLGHRLCAESAQKRWLAHPLIERWLEKALAAQQRAVERQENQRRLDRLDRRGRW